MNPGEIFHKLGGRGDMPPRTGACKGPLLILGGGACVWDDLARFSPAAITRPPCEVMAVNDIGAYYHGVIKHWVSLHPEYFAGWKFFREKHNYGNRAPFLTHACPLRGGVAKAPVDVLWAVENRGGTSGLLACFIALMLGYDRITLAGIPMDGSGHFFEPPSARTAFNDGPNHGLWREAAADVFKGRVKSLSGWTGKLLGPPAGIPGNAGVAA